MTEQRSHSDGQRPRQTPEWGPVCRGYQVLLPDGRRGSVEEIRLGEDGVELIVTTGLFVRRQLTIGEDEIDAILPATYRVVVRGSEAGDGRSGVDDVETVGGILGMPVLHSLRAGSVREDAE